MKRSKLFFIAIALSCSFTLFAQAPNKPTSADLFHDLQQLNVLGSVLYVAAHPDDENTRMISYFSNEKQFRTTYLSLTRGDGGQNLIGTELAEQLGVIRTQELLAARRIDGGNQWFSRANDFGYSKHPDETLKIWDRDQVLADAVWAIRKHRPDIIINRFDHESAGKTHGHHTASAMIGYEAFDLAGRADAFPEQLKYVEVWQAKRLFFNTSWWFYGSRENFEKADKSDMVAIDAGVYFPLMGKSNTEIAAESRSMHQCQGMGNTGTRGSQIEYLKILKGDFNKGSTDVMEGVNTSWSRVKGGEAIGSMLDDVIRDFDLGNPGASAPALAKVLAAIQSLPNGYWKKIKATECIELIKGCLGLFVEIKADVPTAVPGATVKCKAEVIQRMGKPIAFEGIDVANGLLNLLYVYKNDGDLVVNEKINWDFDLVIPENAKVSNPYWLESKGSLGMYDVPDQSLRGQPESAPAFVAKYMIAMDGVRFSIEEPIIFKKTDPVKGEIYRPFYLTEPATLSIQEKVVVFADDASQLINIKVKALADNVKGKVKIKLPNGWTCATMEQNFDLAQNGEASNLQFAIKPPAGQSEGNVSAKIVMGENEIAGELINIEYDHIPAQQVLKPAQSRIVKLDIQKVGTYVGYIMGAGDKVPASLEQIGYTVDLLDVNNLSLEKLSTYNAVIVGIRAFNTEPSLKFGVRTLHEYVKQGGNVIVQYNTNRRMVTKEIAPYLLKLSRDRVSVEEAEIRILTKEHPVLNIPNVISQKDFDGWVQERGLYFANEWAPEFTPILSANDPGEDPKDGGLMVAPYGKGYFIYTGYSWFRQLPAGVPGAYRLFANMISLGQDQRP